VEVVVPDLSGGKGGALLARQEAAGTRRTALRRDQKNRRKANSDISLEWGGGGFFPLVDPESIDSFTCLGVHVSGADISSDFSDIPEPSECGSSVPSSVKSPGKILGLIPVTGGALSMDVPMGAEVNVQLFGMVSSDGTCPSASRVISDVVALKSILRGEISEEDLAGIESLRLYDLPIELASSSVTISSDSQIRLTPNLEVGNLKPVFCDGTTAVRPRLQLLDLMENGNSVFSSVSASRSALSLSSSGTILEASLILEFDQHLQGFSLADSLELVGASMQGQVTQLGPGSFLFQV
jgi:hypothetical protein